MRTLHVLAVAGVLLVSSLAFAAPTRDAEPTVASTEPDVSHHTVTSFDGTAIRVTVFRPADATPEDPVPVVLHSHGWSGSRATTVTGMAGRLVTDGFGVVSIDARGHGESGGMATVHHKDAEVKDFIAVLDWIHDTLAWVQKQPETGIPKDVVAGGAGYSYGGGFQLQLASHDRRLDALAPEITWSDLNEALAPDGEVKSVWVHALLGLALESGTRMDPRIPEWYAAGMATNELPAAAKAHFEGSSPVLADIDADVLLIQGVPDVLFNLNQALRTYDALEASGHGRDIRLFTHLTGHVLPIQPFQFSQTRRMPFEDVGPCGSIEATVSAWLTEKLAAGPASGIPEASFAMDDGTCLRLDEVPTTSFVASLPVAAATTSAGTLLLPLAQGPLTLAGVGHLSATAPLATPGARGHAGLVVLAPNGNFRVLDDQTQPFHVENDGTIDRDLVGVAAYVQDGETLALRIDGLNEWYATNSPRIPGAAALLDVQVTLPVVEDA